MITFFRWFVFFYIGMILILQNLISRNFRFKSRYQFEIPFTIIALLMTITLFFLEFGYNDIFLIIILLFFLIFIYVKLITKTDIYIVFHKMTIIFLLMLN